MHTGAWRIASIFITAQTRLSWEAIGLLALLTYTSHLTLTKCVAPDQQLPQKVVAPDFGIRTHGTIVQRFGALPGAPEQLHSIRACTSDVKTLIANVPHELVVHQPTVPLRRHWAGQHPCTPQGSMQAIARLHQIAIAELREGAI